MRRHKQNRVWHHFYADKVAIQVAAIASEAKVIAVHMEALDHCETSRKNLQQSATAAGFSSNRIIIPVDGETIGF